MEINVRELYGAVRRKYGFQFDLTKEQEKIVEAVLRGQHTFGVLPAGFERNLTYILPPLLLDEAAPSNAPHVTVVHSPLRSQISHQLAMCQKKKIASVAITGKEEIKQADLDCVKDGKWSVLFISPEVLDYRPWRNMIRSFSKRICLVALDEVQCLSEWGNDFHPDHLRVVDLRSILTKTPFLGLSEATTDHIVSHVKDILHIEDVLISALVPDRPNIFLEVVHKDGRFDIEKDLGWIIEGIRQQKENYPKTIIFCASVMGVYDVYSTLMANLGADGYMDGRPKSHKTRLMSMFHEDIGSELHEFTVDTFRRLNSSLRVLVSTIAFGMGVEVPDIRHVVHWGRSKSMLCHWQEVGRAGRDGQPAKATWFPKTTAGEDRELFETLKKKRDVCVRETILGHFHLTGVLYSEDVPRPSCLRACCLRACCSHCASKCPEHSQQT